MDADGSFDRVSTSDLVLLPRAASADAVGVPASSVLALLDGLEADGIELHSLMVVRQGQVAAEGWWSPYGPGRPHLLYSLSKSFASTAVGFAIAEGRFGLDDTIVSLLPGHVPDDIHPAVATLTVHHVLSMSTGHNADTLERAWTLEPHDLVKGFLRVPPQEPVGSRHVYNNTCTYVLAMLVQELTGEHLLDYLRPRLLDPLGIGPAHWDNDTHGNAVGFSGLHLTTEAVAAFGQLLLQRGSWQGTQLLPDGWVELATRKHIDTDLDPARSVDWRQGYGYQYWMARHGFRGDGAFGQLCVVVPESDLVVATTACTEDLQGILTAVWDVLLPALDPTDNGLPHGMSEERQAQQELDRRLTSLALPVVGGETRGTSSDDTFVMEHADGEAPFPAGTTVRVMADGDSAWTVSIGMGERSMTFGCGHDSWLETVLAPVRGVTDRDAGSDPDGGTAVLARGGWTTPDTFEADLVPIELPHRIRLSCTGGRATARWNFVPLGGARLGRHLH